MSSDEGFAARYDECAAHMNGGRALLRPAPAELDGQHRPEPVPHTLTYSVGDSRIDIDLDGGGRSSLWWATKNEWLGLLDVAGLEVETLYRGFDGEPFTDESREYVFVAVKPAS